MAISIYVCQHQARAYIARPREKHVWEVLETAVTISMEDVNYPPHDGCHNIRATISIHIGCHSVQSKRKIRFIGMV